MKNRVRSQQIEREKEQTDHAVMLRELQKLLANERQAKEQLENQVVNVTRMFKSSAEILNNLLSNSTF